jgi:NAD(P)-dependent dehydrogenase (short-subunit alcohol dehydrogenase family)
MIGSAIERKQMIAAGPLGGKVALVTGASSGIGAATARELAQHGAKVILAARRAAELDSQVSAIIAAGGQATAIPTDVMDPAQVARLAERVEAEFGGIDILVNNAGIGITRAFARTAPEDITRLMETNLVGMMLLTRAVLPGMMERGRGAIIAVASVAGMIAVDPVYSASKFGVRGFMLSLRRQLAGSGVSASIVDPGYIRTPMNSRARSPFIPGPEVVARAITRLASHPRREVVVPRYYRIAVWLEHAFPWLADRAMRPRRKPKR